MLCKQKAEYEKLKVARCSLPAIFSTLGFNTLDVQKNDFGERLSLFRRCFIRN